MAMQATLKVDPDKLTSTANQFQSYNTKIGSLATQMTNIITSLKGTNVWQGEAQTAYTGKLSQLSQDMTDVRKKLTDFINDLNQIAANYKKSESTNVGSASPLGTDYVH